MKKLRCINRQFFYGEIPVTKPFARVLVRQISKHQEEVQLVRQRRAFKIIAEQQGW
jgi:hypothetical protein